MDEALRRRVAAWMEVDPDPATRAELEQLLTAGDERALASRFGVPLPFGTAGIRGPRGAGPARMNRLVVRRTTAGLATWLLETSPDVRERGVIVGWDARHGSEAFAAETAGVLAAAGINVQRFDRPVPTPLLAFAVRHLRAAAGVQITASHNPASDNGYKIYTEGGRQIVPPTDAEIRARIDALPEAVAAGPAPGDGAGIAIVRPEVYPAYVNGVLALLGLEVGTQRNIRIVYTPLHGVALDLVRGVLEAAGFRDLHVVEAQEQADPDFPTIAFPNPEEPGVLDLALALAEDVDADLVLANDPDGDRIAVALPERDGTWRVLSGDEMGCMLASTLVADEDVDQLVATTVVSSRLLAKIARQRGLAYTETLTGFKWLAAAAVEAARHGREMVLAYEQALGVMIGTHVLDKDGISAAAAVASVADGRRLTGRSLLDVLDELAREHGVHLTGGRNVRLDRPGAPAPVAIIERLRRQPPAHLGDTEVLAVDDYVDGQRRTAAGEGTPLGVPSTLLVGLELADGSRALVRPSGTEPLLKTYGEVVEAVAEKEPVSAARARAERRLEKLLDAFTAAAGL